MTLTSFCLYRVHGKAREPDIEVVAGAMDARFAESGRVQLLAGSVPMRTEAMKSRVPKPGTGMLALYGHRDAIEELQHWRSHARAVRAEFAYVEYSVLVMGIALQLVDRKMLREQGDGMRFLNLRRAHSALQSEIRERLASYVEAEGGSAEAEMGRVSQIATRPDLFSTLLEHDRDMRHLSVVVTSIADDPDVPGKMRQVAFIKPGATITNVVQGSDQYEILLPSWLTDEKIAKKLRKHAEATA